MNDAPALNSSKHQPESEFVESLIVEASNVGRRSNHAKYISNYNGYNDVYY